MGKIEFSESLQESENKLINAYLSLVDNVRHLCTVSVDLADLFNSTWKSETMFLLLEKTEFKSFEDFKDDIDADKFLNDIKSVWIEIRMADSSDSHVFWDVLKATVDAMEKMSNYEAEIYFSDCIHSSPHQNFISIIGFD